jgi:hypothetical protein
MASLGYLPREIRVGYSRFSKHHSYGIVFYEFGRVERTFFGKRPWQLRLLSVPHIRLNLLQTIGHKKTDDGRIQNRGLFNMLGNKLGEMGWRRILEVNDAIRLVLTSTTRFSTSATRVYPIFTINSENASLGTLQSGHNAKQYSPSNLRSGKHRPIQ